MGVDAAGVLALGTAGIAVGFVGAARAVGIGVRIGLVVGMVVPQCAPVQGHTIHQRDRVRVLLLHWQ